MDVEEALADLVDVSPDVQAAVAFDVDGRLTASTLADDARSATVAEAARRLLDDASALRSGPRADEVAALARAGALVAVREGGTAVAAVTAPEPSLLLALHDVRTCLHVLTADADAPLARARLEDDAAR